MKLVIVPTQTSPDVILLQLEILRREQPTREIPVACERTALRMPLLARKNKRRPCEASSAEASALRYRSAVRHQRLRNKREQLKKGNPRIGVRVGPIRRVRCHPFAEDARQLAIVALLEMVHLGTS